MGFIVMMKVYHMNYVGKPTVSPEASPFRELRLTHVKTIQRPCNVSPGGVTTRPTALTGRATFWRPFGPVRVAQRATLLYGSALRFPIS